MDGLEALGNGLRTFWNIGLALLILFAILLVFRRSLSLRCVGGGVLCIYAAFVGWRFIADLPLRDYLHRATIEREELASLRAPDFRHPQPISIWFAVDNNRLETGWPICKRHVFYCMSGIVEAGLTGGVFEVGRDPIYRLILINDSAVCGADESDIIRLSTNRKNAGVGWCLRKDEVAVPTARYEIRFEPRYFMGAGVHVTDLLLVDRVSDAVIDRLIDVRTDRWTTNFGFVRRSLANHPLYRSTQLDILRDVGPLGEIHRRLAGKWETPDGEQWIDRWTKPGWETVLTSD